MVIVNSYFYIALTILFTCYGQLVFKWRIARYGALPDGLIDKLLFLASLFYDPFILTGFLAAFVASLCWMAAITKLPLSHAYPFMALSFAVVLVGSSIFFHETISWPKIIGVLFIVAGIAVGARG